ncbi:MAG: twin-arginine translocase subunit TatC [Armatimonadota bacterium]
MGEGYIEYVVNDSHSSDDAKDFLSHFEELRTRIMYGIMAVILGIVAGWLLYDYAYHFIAGPILASVERLQGEVITLQPAEAFFTRVKLSVALGLTLASPVIIWQLWTFVRPGLTPGERKAVGPLAPAICFLFLFGAALAYLMLPRIMDFFLGYIPDGVHAKLDFQHSINFPLSIMLAFGLAFQLPIAVLGLVLLRILTPQVLLTQWRTAVLALAMIAAVITPTADPMTMLLLLVPLLALYFGTVLLAFRVMKPPARDVVQGDAG